MKILLRVLSLTSLVLTVTACTVTGKPYQEHESDKRKPIEKSEIIAQPENQKPSAEAAGWEARFDGTKDSVVDVLTPLADKVLDPKRITDKTALGDRRVIDELIMFNRLMLKVPKEQRARAEYQALLKRYGTALETECGDFASSCTGIRYFKMSGNSAQISKLIAQNDPENYFRRLLFAIKLKNAYWDADIARMLFENPNAKLSERELKYQESIKSLMATALQSARDKHTTPEAQREFLESIHGWKLAAEDLQTFDSSTQSSLYEMIAGAGYMYAADGSLHPEFKVLLDKVQADPEGFFAAQNNLHEQKIISVEAIGASYIQNFDELYYLIDEMFNGRITAQSAATLFGASKKSEKDLQEALQNYMRIRFLLALTETSKIAQKLLTSSVEAKNLLFHFMRESASITAIWSGFISRSGPVKNFAILAVRKRDNSLETERKIQSLFDSLQTSINLTSAVPHTLILFHMLSQKRFELVVPFSGRKFDTGQIMRMYFTGKIAQILIYAGTENQAPVNMFHMVHSFDFALRTNLFKIVKIDPDYFIADTLRRLNGDATDGIDTNLNAIRARFNQTSTYTEFKAACEEFKGKPISRSFYFKDIGLSPFYGPLLNAAFTDVTDGSETVSSDPGQLIKRSMGINYIDKTYSEMLEKARLDLGTTTRLGQGMLDSYVQYLRANNTPDDEIETKTKLTREALAQNQERRKTVLATAKSWMDEIGGCYWKAFAKDQEIQFKVIETERAYLRQVHRDIKRLRSPDITPEQKAAIQARIQLKGMPSKFTGLDKISAEGYVSSELDFKIRAAKYLMEGLTTDEGTIAPLAPGLQVEFGSRLDVEVDIVAGSVVRDLKFVESETDFVAANLKWMFNGEGHGRNAFLHWLDGTSGRLISWDDYMKTLISLYRLEREVTGSSKNFTGENILNAHRDILDKVKFRPEERQLFSEIFLTKKFDPLFLDHRMLLYNIETGKIQDYWGLFDMPVRMMNEEALGFTYDTVNAGMGNVILPRFGHMSVAKLYFSSRAKDSRGTTVIPFNRELDKVMDSLVGNFVKTDLKAVQDFHNLTISYTNQLARQAAESRPRVDLNIYESITGPQLNDVTVSSFNSKLKLFNIGTDNCFNSDKPCASFEQ